MINKKTRQLIKKIRKIKKIKNYKFKFLKLGLVMLIKLYSAGKSKVKLS